jgi:hypothetical protein
VTTTAVPQNIKALNKANRVRYLQAAFRREVRNDLDYSEGCAQLAEVLERKDLPQYLGAMKLDRFLIAPRRMGEAHVSEVYRRARITRHSPNLRLRDLTEREKTSLSAELRSRCSPVEKAA